VYVQVVCVPATIAVNVPSFGNASTDTTLSVSPEPVSVCAPDAVVRSEPANAVRLIVPPISCAEPAAIQAPLLCGWFPPLVVVSALY